MEYAREIWSILQAIACEMRLSFTVRRTDTASTRLPNRPPVARWRKHKYKNR
jgi:hypothetical protein